MNHNEVSSIISKITAIKEDYDVFFWIGTDGIFHKTPNPNPEDELVCCCGISYSTDTGDWIVTPWLYNMDIPAIFKSAENARVYAFFWLNWITYLYGDEVEEPDFEADWLAVKSNRSVVMMLFDMASTKFRDELYDKEKTMGINPADGEISDDISQDFTYNAQDYIEDAEHGDTDAQFILAECYKDGKGIEQDYAKALEWYEKALNANTKEDEKQTVFLAAVYKDIAECYQNLKENKKSIEYLKKALAIYETQGKENTAEKVRKVIDQKETDEYFNAFFKWAVDLYNEKRYEEALPLFESLAAQEHSGAMYYLLSNPSWKYASMADPDTRLNWIQKAADDGLIEAQEYIDKLKKEGKL